MKDMQGKVAIVTGGAAGIGRATALLFARAGAQVVVADWSEAAGREVVEAIEREGGEALWQRVDVSRDEDCSAMVDATLRHFGRLDIAFNNAGVSGRIARTDDQGLDNWHKVIGVNLTGVFQCMVHELRAMKAHGGAIINTASVAGVKGAPYSAAYSASKHGVIGLTRSAAREYGKYGIRINAVCPGYIQTAMADEIAASSAPGSSDALLAASALRRAAEPGEVAELVLWLSSDKASFVTGAHYLVDGGLIA
ncbi:glucose 1-dehydrogenase [Paraburkholderia sp. Tr-20389]|uniref:SDR family NAD(P)-dependent oxidoreductase n=1 Tax=Paraburkholderia sp. Tr-20389 TaxID=2703903 RepID=UPI0019802A22|nr:glucose 1-dehydrogenase [Paraburkholderia sp. Tr-20389]MBN3755619.1 glucose 1-dehydrogenase [Paraburkholderia sp. Tr-20389]